MSAQFIRVNIIRARSSSGHLGDTSIKAEAQVKAQVKACDLAWYKGCEWINKWVRVK